MNLWLWGTTINETVSAASQGHMYDRFDDMEKEKGAIPKPSPWVTIGNVATEVPLSAAGRTLGHLLGLLGLLGLRYLISILFTHFVLINLHIIAP